MANHIDHFATDHLLSDLKGRTISSGLIRTAAQAVQFALTLGYNIILARLLSPDEFGLVAMVMTIVSFLQIFQELGLSTATIQRSDITHAQVSNLFWLNFAVSGTVSAIVAILSPAIAWFYHEPRLIHISIALSLYFVLNGLAAQHMALLNRQMRFVAISLLEVGAIGTSLIAGVTMALAGFGYWSLVGATLTQAAVRLLAVWSISRWRPQLPARGAGTRPLVGFRANLTLSGFLYSASANSDSLLVGRIYGSDAVGLYTRAVALLSRPMRHLISPIYTVVVPALSRLQTHPDRYRRFYLQIFEILAIAGFVFTGLVIPLAHPITITILGTKWEAAAPIFAGLSAVAIYAPLSSAVSWLYTSQGRGEDMLRLSIIEAIVTVLAVVVGLPFGPVGVAIALSVCGIFVKLPLTFFIAGRSGPVNVMALWSSFLRQLPVLIVITGATWAARNLVTSQTDLWELLACVPVGVLAGAVTLFLSPPSRQVCAQLFRSLNEMRERRRRPLGQQASR